MILRGERRDTSVHLHTLSEDVHRIVDLDVHMVADSLQLLTLRRDDLPVPALDLVRGSAILGEPAGNHDALAIVLRSVRFIALVLEDDRDLRYTVRA